MSTINSRTETLDSLTTSTWYDVRKTIIDQVLQIIPFYSKMVEGGRIKEKIPDGTHWEYPVRYALQDQNIKWFGRGATFGRTEKESLTRLFYYCKNLGTSVVRFWDDDQKNRGKAKIIEYVGEITESTKEALKVKLANSILVQDTDSNAMTALPTLISTTPTTGSIGGITRSTDAYLQNNIKDFTGLTTGNSLVDEMDRINNLCSMWRTGGRQAPNMWLTTRVIYQDYERVCRSMQQIVTNKTERASLGFGELMYKNAEVYWDPDCPSGCMYALNTDSLELPYDPDNWFEMTDWKSDPDTLDRVAQVVCRCNLICKQFRQNGVIYNITATTT